MIYRYKLQDGTTVTEVFSGIKIVEDMGIHPVQYDKMAWRIRIYGGIHNKKSYTTDNKMRHDALFEDVLDMVLKGLDPFQKAQLELEERKEQDEKEKRR